MNRAQLVEAALTRALSTVAARGAQTILIDGPSGAGKTSFSALLAQRLPRSQVVHLDDFYPGWGGLAAGADMVARYVLRAESPGFWRWDWERDRRGEWVDLDGEALLILEGVGALTPAAVAAARRRGEVVNVWLDGPREKRRALALARDPGYEPWFGVWEAQEREHFAAVDVEALGIDVRVEWR